MHLPTITPAAVRAAAALLIGSIAFAQSTSATPQTAPAAGPSSPGFDGKWLTKLTCPPKGNTEGYTWQIPSVVQDSNFRGERGTAGEPGYLLIEGKIAKDGSAKLSANGIVASRNYARGILAHKGAEYSYDIKAKFEGTAGTGTRDMGLGIVGRPCTFDFAKQ
ncbi:MAG: hypothetical protein WBL61_08880 [Bryobacteraceae bacterium]